MVPVNYNKDGKWVPLPKMDIASYICYLCGIDNLDALDNFPENGSLTLIIVACRGPCYDEPPESLKLMRERSQD
jgi:hypothetical protein